MLKGGHYHRQPDANSRERHTGEIRPGEKGYPEEMLWV
jgi:hypothetical protein